MEVIKEIGGVVVKTPTHRKIYGKEYPASALARIGDNVISTNMYLAEAVAIKGLSQSDRYDPEQVFSLFRSEAERASCVLDFDGVDISRQKVTLLNENTRRNIDLGFYNYLAKKYPSAIWKTCPEYNRTAVVLFVDDVPVAIVMPII